MAALKAGRSFATNGPLLGFTLGGAEIGDELKFDRRAAARQFLGFDCDPSSPWTIWTWCATAGWCAPSSRAKQWITANSAAAFRSTTAAGASRAPPPTQEPLSGTGHLCIRDYQPDLRHPRGA